MKMKSKITLKPCPFCGEIPVIEKRTEISERSEETVYQVVCDNEYCSIHPETYLFGDKKNAIKDWNRRADNG